MRRYFKTALAACCALALLLSPSAVAAPRQETATAKLWGMLNIVAGGTDIGLYTEEHIRVVPLSYQNSAYIPLSTFGELLGAETQWDADSATVTITTGLAPVYRDHRDQPDEMSLVEYTKEGLANGVEATVYPDAAILVDGAPHTFSTAEGQALSPLRLNGILYLPLRGVSELGGGNLLFLPQQVGVPEVTAPVTPERLLEPQLQAQRPWDEIYLYRQPTQAELQAVESYLTKIQALYQQLCHTLLAPPATENLSSDQAADWLMALSDLIDEMRKLPEPESSFFHARYERIHDEAEYLWNWSGPRDTLAKLLNKEVSPEESLNGMDATVASKLQNLRMALPWGAEVLDAVKKQCAAASDTPGSFTLPANGLMLFGDPASKGLEPLKLRKGHVQTLTIHLAEPGVIDIGYRLEGEGPTYLSLSTAPGETVRAEIEIPADGEYYFVARNASISPVTVLDAALSDGEVGSV